MFDNYWRLVTHSIYTFSKTPVCDMPWGISVSLSRLADELCLVSIDHGNFSTCLAYGETRYATHNNRSSVATLCLFGYIDQGYIWWWWACPRLCLWLWCRQANGIFSRCLQITVFCRESPLQPLKVSISINLGHFCYLRLLISNVASLLFIFLLSLKDVQVAKIQLANSALKLIRVKLLTS